MASGFSGEFLYGGGRGGGVSGGGRVTTIVGSGGNPGGVGGGGISGVPFGFRQQLQPQQQQQMMFLQQHQHQHQQGMGMQGYGLQDQIQQRRVDLLGKRSFGDYQTSLQQQVYQQHGSGLSYLQKPQQQQQQQQLQQFLMRSVKQRSANNSILTSSPFCPTIDLTSPTHNHNNNSFLNNSHNIVMNNSSTRFGVPVYQQPRQQQVPFLNNINHLNTINTINNSNNNNKNKNINSLIVPSDLNLANPVQSTGLPVGTIPVDGRAEEVKKVLNTLEEIEQLLLADVDDAPVQTEGEQPVSGVTDSVWSDLVNPSPSLSPTLISNPNPTPSPSPVQASASISCSNNNNNNCNTVTTPMISPSPTSSTSSCCSTSASASPPATAPQTVAATARQLITEVATVIADGKSEGVMESLAKLGQIADVKGNSEQRLAYYMCNALKCRACPSENPPPIMELFAADQMASSYALYDISPCYKFGLLAANLVMLEAISSGLQKGLKVHVIDFDVGNGGQYINLLRALADRKSQSLSRSSACIRITVVQTEVIGDHDAVKDSVKEGLVKLAELVGINLEIETVTRAVHELTREVLGCEEGEAVVVNFAFKLYRVPDESVSMENLRDELLRRVKGLSPRAVALVEQDMNGNTAPFLVRVNEACASYGALFDSFDATLPRDNADRCRVEEGLGKKMANTVACEGRERVERSEVFGKWRARMSMAGFEMKALGHSVVESMRARLNSGRGGNPGFTVKDENGGVGFGWNGRSLTVASAWR